MNLSYMTQATFRTFLQDSGLASPLVDDAIKQAERSHKDQLRDNGNSYLTEHIYPVAYETVQSYRGKPVPVEVVAAALLHDAIEDDPGFTYKTCQEKFGTKIADIVQALTKNTSENNPSSNQDEKARLNRIYMQRLVSGPSEALIIKLADRYCNLVTVHTIKNTNPGKYNRYIQETADLFLPLAQKHSAYFYNRLQELLRSF